MRDAYVEAATAWLERALPADTADNPELSRITSPEESAILSAVQPLIAQRRTAAIRALVALAKALASEGIDGESTGRGGSKIGEGDSDPRDLSRARAKAEEITVGHLGGAAVVPAAQGSPEKRTGKRAKAGAK